MRKLPKELLQARSNLIDALTRFNELSDDFMQAAEAYQDERSEKWRESDAASDYQDWLYTIESASDTAANLLDDLEQLEVKPGA